MIRAWKVAPLFAVSLGLALAACGSPSSTSASGGTSGGASTPKHLAFTSKGTPNLKGFNIPIATAGSHPGDEDTVGYIMEKTLQKWGATSALNLAEAPAGADAVVAGKIDAVNSDMPSLLNLPLSIFMPNQVRLDYVFVSRDAKTLSDLQGKTIDVGTKTAAQYMLMPALLKEAHLTKSQVTLDFSGSSSGSSLGTALSTGRADAAWVHISNVSNIKTSVPHLYVLAKATVELPDIADSFWAATPSFLKSNPAIAEALCLAYIAAVKTFNKDQAQWVSDAEAYTLNADPVSSVQADYATYAGLHLWPLLESAYTTKTVATNYDFYKSFGEFSGSGLRALSKVAVFGPWQAAWQAYNSHPSAY